MSAKQINIEDELAILWQRVYNAIVDIVKSNNMVNVPVEINTNDVKSIIVDSSGYISVTSYNGENDFLENYEDDVIYKIYEKLLCHSEIL